MTPDLRTRCGIAVAAACLSVHAQPTPSGDPQGRDPQGTHTPERGTLRSAGQASRAPPVVRTLDFAAARRPGQTYRLGDVVVLRITFDRAVLVYPSPGRETPTVTLEIGPREARAVYREGSGTRRLTFEYRVRNGDVDRDGITVPPAGLSANGAAIQGLDGAPAVLALETDALESSHLVDGVPPELDEDWLSVSPGMVRIRFSEPLMADSVPPASAFRVTADGVPRVVAGRSISADTVQLRVVPAISEDAEAVVVHYERPPGTTRHVRDAAGNPASTVVRTWHANAPPVAATPAPAPAALQGMHAAARARALESIGSILVEKAGRTPAQRKMSSELLRLSSKELEGEVEIDIRADATPELAARIVELGGRVVNAAAEYRSMRVVMPIAALEALAETEGVQTLDTAERGVTWQAPGERAPGAPDPKRTSTARAASTGTTTSEGDIAHQANLARQTHGVDGTGIGIGVISDGIRTLASRQASGDLPATVTVLPGQAGAGDEGTAMLEIVHDLAPGAELYFAQGTSGEAQMAANIRALCARGADIIVDDLSYDRDPAFQDGVISQGISAAVTDGCLYFAAAGNGGNLNDGTSGVWEGDFVAGDPLTVDGQSVGQMHDFGSGVHENRIEKDPRRSFGLQWADPLGASANDYDLFLVDAQGDVLKSSTTTQNGLQDPFERITSAGDHTDARLVVVKVSGSGRYLRLYAQDGELAVATAGNTYGHQAAEDAISVAAVEATMAAFDGTESVETFSSDGPRRIFYNADGTAITAGNFSSTGGRLVSKPDLAAADAVSTTTPGFETFRGTSAAAPHAAAIAALMLQARGGPNGFTPALARIAMAQGAHDIEAAGVDRDAGNGLVMAPGAVGAVAVAIADRNKAPTVANAISDQTLVPGGDAATFDLDNVFADPNDDDLTFSAAADDPVRVGLEIDAATGVLTLTPTSPGSTTVAIRATDPDGLAAMLTFEVTLSLGSTDYDTDNDGLIEVRTLAQLDAIRYDLNADGAVDGTDWQTHAAAFPQAALGMGCPTGCSGFELTANLDFDTNGNGMADPGDAYWNSGSGWTPIGLFPDEFTGTFEGNLKTISNLYINTTSRRARRSSIRWTRPGPSAASDSSTSISTVAPSSARWRVTAR